MGFNACRQYGRTDAECRRIRGQPPPSPRRFRAHQHGASDAQQCVPNGRPRQTRCPSRPFRGRRGATFQNRTSDAHGRAPAEIGTGQPSPQARAPLPGRGSAAPTSALARAGPVSGRGGLGSPARRTDVEVGVVANQQRNDVDAVVERGPVHRRAADLVPVTGVFVTACPETLLPTLWTVEAGRTTQFFSSSILPLLLTPVLLPLPRKSESLFPKDRNRGRQRARATKAAWA